MNSLKIFCFFLLVAVAAAASQLEDPFSKARAQCLRECGLKQEDVTIWRNDLRKISTYVGCMGRRTNLMKDDGTLNLKVYYKKVEFTSPSAIVKRLADCCIDQVYGRNLHRQSHRHHLQQRNYADRIFTDYVICVKNKIPGELWGLIGVLEPSKWDALNTCKA